MTAVSALLQHWPCCIAVFPQSLRFVVARAVLWMSFDIGFNIHPRAAACGAILPAVLAILCDVAHRQPAACLMLSKGFSL